MICLVEALNYRCLRYVRQPLDGFHVLVGANASGKTTFLDVISFLGRLVSDGLDAAVEERTRNFHDLVWGREGSSFELALELVIPDDLRQRLTGEQYQIVRYEVRIGADEPAGEVQILSEKAGLKQALPGPSQSRTLFPMEPTSPGTLLTKRGDRSLKVVINKVRDGNDNFYGELGKGWAPSFKLGPRKSALGNVPPDESRFPVSTWLKELLTEGIQSLVLNSMLIRRASPPGQIRTLKPDGSNLPWVVEHLREKDPGRFGDWVAHLRTALPDIRGIRTVERPEDRHRYLMLEYHGGLDVPSWVVSDGTLRLLALTLPAYLPDFKGVYLIEEPENGIHPKAVETMFQSLSSVYGAQILLATHSPVVVSIASEDQVLCFAKDARGATDIVLGREHPALRDWQGQTNLGVLFAGGVLG